MRALCQLEQLVSCLSLLKELIIVICRAIIFALARSFCILFMVSGNACLRLSESESAE